MAINMKLNIVDRIINYFSPSWAAKRIHVRASLMASLAVHSGRRVISSGIEIPTRKHEANKQGDENYYTPQVQPTFEEKLPDRIHKRTAPPSYHKNDRERFRLSGPKRGL